MRYSTSDKRVSMITSRRIFFCALVGFGWSVALLAQICAHAEDASQLASKGELRAALIASNPVLVTRGADGGLGGYRWGVVRKRALLEQERAGTTE